MRILVVADSIWPDDTGGVSKSVYSEVKGLVGLGHHVVVLTRNLYAGLPADETTKDGYNVFRYVSPAKGKICYRLYPFYTLVQVPRMVERLQKRTPFDIAYVHNPIQAVALQRSTVGMPYVYVFHAPMPLEILVDGERGKYGILRPLANAVAQWCSRIEQQALSHAAALVVRSEFMAEQLRALYPSLVLRDVIRIPLGVDTSRFAFVGDPEVVRASLGLPSGIPLLISVRRLVARMGIENLIESMVEVTRQIPKALLLIGGRGYLEPRLRALVDKRGLKENVRFLGFVPEDVLPCYYQAADLFVLPTVALEGFGLATIEALSCGTPVIATPVGANTEVLGPLAKELITSDVTPQALSERIVALLRRPDRSELRKLCRRHCEDNFRIEHVTQRIAEMLVRIRHRGKRVSLQRAPMMA